MQLFTPPARRAWRSYKFASLDFFYFFFGVESWAAAHGWYRWHQVAWAHRNTAFNGGICQQNMYFNMYTTISKPQEGLSCKDSHAKCFIMTISTAKLSPGAVNRDELWERVSNACFLSSSAVFHVKIYTSIKPIYSTELPLQNTLLVCKYWRKSEQMILYAKHPTRNVLKRQILIDSHRFHQGMSLPNSPKISLANIEFRYAMDNVLCPNFKSNM